MQFCSGLSYAPSYPVYESHEAVLMCGDEIMAMNHFLFKPIDDRKDDE